jgi:hypothetical protein
MLRKTYYDKCVHYFASSHSTYTSGIIKATCYLPEPITQQQQEQASKQANKQTNKQTNGVWCAESARKIIGLTCVQDSVNSKQHVDNIL